MIGLALAVLLWSTYAYMIWTPGVLDRAGSVKGWDFPQFYAVGYLASHGRRADVADMTALHEVAATQVAGALETSTIVPVYGPQIALLFARLGTLSYLAALRVWIVISSLLYAASIVLLFRACRDLSGHAATVAILAIGSPAFFFLVCYAQLSAVSMILFAAAFLALQRGRPLMAGIAIGSLVYKPQLAIPIGLVWLLAGEWRAVAGAVSAAAVQLIAAWSFVGTAAMRAYVDTIVHINDNISLVQQKRYLLQSLSAFFQLILPWPRVALLAYAIAAVAVLVTALMVWRSGAPLELRYSMLLLTTVLVSPHLYVYDLLLLTVLGFLLADWLACADVDGRERGAFGLCLALLYVVPLITSVSARNVRIQPTALVLAVLAFLIARRSSSLRADARIPRLAPLRT